MEAKCVDPCSIPNSCGHDATCVVENHVGLCSCQPGTTGNPLLGCVGIQYCSSDNQCPSGTICNSGVCCAICTSNRDCLTDQLCLQSVCQPTCHGNSSCPDFQYCLNNICTQEVRCTSDNDCPISEKCVIDSYGRPDCKNACQGRVLCGRNAECTARNHNAVCSCKQGFVGDGQVGCRRIECESDSDCSNDKLCDKNTCISVCQVGNPCGEKAICSPEKHRPVCHCQPGFSGDPYNQCTLIDYCRSAPCGSRAECTNSKASFHCACPSGYVGDPYKDGCRLAFECHTHSDCPPSAECIQSNQESKCRDVCSRVTCGPNADCLAIEHIAHCNCRPGYGGEPSDIRVGCRPLPVPCASSAECPVNTYCYGGVCKHACSLDQECALDEVCLSGQCINPCLQPQACGMNADCTTVNHHKQCSCPAGFIGNSAIECIRGKYTV